MVLKVKLVHLLFAIELAVPIETMEAAIAGEMFFLRIVCGINMIADCASRNQTNASIPMASDAAL